MTNFERSLVAVGMVGLLFGNPCGVWAEPSTDETTVDDVAPDDATADKATIDDTATDDASIDDPISLIEEITVTARRREESLQDTPISISAYTAEGLDYRGVTTIDQIAEFTPIEKFMPVENIADRAAAFGIPGRIVDGNDVMAVYETAQEAIKRARDGKGPSLVECKTCRVRPMSELDGPEKGLPEHVIEAWKKKDPVKRATEHMLEIGALTEGEIGALREQFQKEVDEAFEFAEQMEYAPADEVFRDVYADGGEVIV